MSVLADLVVLLHFAFILFVIFGAMLGFIWRRALWVHFPALVWGASIEFFGWICPLTHLENALRRESGAVGYEHGFIEEYLLPVMYPADLTRELQILLGVALVIFNLTLYSVVLRSRKPVEGSAGSKHNP